MVPPMPPVQPPPVSAPTKTMVPLRGTRRRRGTGAVPPAMSILRRRSGRRPRWGRSSGSRGTVVAPQRRTRRPCRAAHPGDHRYAASGGQLHDVGPDAAGGAVTSTRSPAPTRAASRAGARSGRRSRARRTGCVRPRRLVAELVLDCGRVLRQRPAGRAEDAVPGAKRVTLPDRDHGAGDVAAWRRRCRVAASSPGRAGPASASWSSGARCRGRRPQPDVQQDLALPRRRDVDLGDVEHVGVAVPALHHGPHRARSGRAGVRDGVSAWSSGLLDRCRVNVRCTVQFSTLLLESARVHPPAPPQHVEPRPGGGARRTARGPRGAGG